MSDTVTIPLSKEFKLEVEKALVRYKALQREYEEDYKKVAQFHKELANKLEPDVAKIFEQWDGVDYKLTPEYKTVHGFFGSKKVRDCLKVEPSDLFETNGDILKSRVEREWSEQVKVGSNYHTYLIVRDSTYASSYYKVDFRTKFPLEWPYCVILETYSYLSSRQSCVRKLEGILKMFDSVEGKEISMSVSEYNKYFKEV